MSVSIGVIASSFVMTHSPVTSTVNAISTGFIVVVEYSVDVMRSFKFVVIFSAVLGAVAVIV